MSDLTELLEWIENADGRDDRLSIAVADAFGQSTIPHYTSSIDDALALVEKVLPGWSWRIGNTLSRPPDIPIPGAVCQLGANGLFAEAATPPLAILAALLKAKIAEAESTSRPPKPEPQPSSQG